MTYDAFKEDIAVANFYFEEPTIFEYMRHENNKLMKIN